MLLTLLLTGTKIYAQETDDDSVVVVNVVKPRVVFIDGPGLEKLHIMEDSLIKTSDSMYEAFIPDTHVEYCARFVRQLVKALKVPNSYYYDFSKLKKKINIIYADDSSFRILNWAIKPSPASERYYGAIQLRTENLKLFGLIDVSEDLGKNLPDTILTDGKWYGAIYYRIMGNIVNGRKIYTLFGFNGGSTISNKKVLDPLTIDESGIAFGAPIFGVGSENNPGRRVNRYVIEYKKGVQASMNWDAERHAIVLDNLTSEVNDPRRKYTYVPSGEYDGFRWGGEMWNFIHNIIPITILKDGEAPGGEEIQPQEKR